MGAIRTSARQVFRDFVVNGLPSSGENEPDKAQVRGVFDLIEDAQIALEGMQGNGVVGYRNYSGTPGLAADLLHGAGTKGEVWQQAGTHTDPATSGSVTNIGTYEKRGISGAGDWAWMGALDVTSLGTRMTSAEADINSLETDVGGLLSDMTTAQGDITTLQSGKVPTTRTVNGHALSADVTVSKADVGLGNVDNTSDATKNAAAVTLTNKTLTAPVINSPTGIVKGDVGLGNVDNTSDAAKNAAAVTLTNKTLTAPVLTGAGTSTTPTLGDRSTRIATMEAVGKEQDYAGLYATEVTTGTSTAYATTLVVGPLDAYRVEQKFLVWFHINCGNNPTLNVDGRGAYNLKDEGGGSIAANDLLANHYYIVRLASIASTQMRVQVADVKAIKATIAALDAAKQDADDGLTSLAGLTGTGVVRQTGASTFDNDGGKADVGLGNVDNTSDANKPISSATQTALDAKQASDAGLTSLAGLTGTGVVRQTGANTFDNDAAKGDVGLGNVDNIADVDKPISTATQAALDIKAFARPIPAGRHPTYGAPERITESNVFGEAAMLQHRKENLSWSEDGPKTQWDWRARAKGEPGQVYIWAPGVTSDIRFSTDYDGDSHDYPKIAGLSLSWQADAAGTLASPDRYMGGVFDGIASDQTAVGVFPWKGQSTEGIGNLNNEVISGTPLRPTRSFMPIGSYRAYNNEHLIRRRHDLVWAADLMDFIPGYEMFHGITGQKSGETMGSVFGAQLTGAGQLAATMSVVQAFFGVGGISPNECAQGTVLYNNMIEFVRRSIDVTKFGPRPNGNPRDPVGLGFGQPWHENQIASARAAVKSDVKAAQAEVQADFRKLFCTSDDYGMFTDQLNSFGTTVFGPHVANVPWGVADAALECPAIRPAIALVCSRYLFPHFDKVHLYAASEAWRAAYFARHVARWWNNKSCWPTHILSVELNGTAGKITFYHWPDAAGNMSFGPYDIVPSIANYGLEYEDDGGTVDFSPGSFDWDDDTGNELLFDLTGAPGSNPIVKIASQEAINDAGPAGPRSNIMSPSLDVGFYGESMHNWAIAQTIAATVL